MSNGSSPTELSRRDEARSEGTSSSEFADRLERLVLRFLRIEIRTAAALWRLQVDLFDLQMEIQAGIAQHKERVRVGTPERHELEQLRYLRSAARRFGDAIAWVMLGLDRRVINALAMNKRVPVAPDRNHGRRGLLAAAEVMSNQGAGFPLLHDITDILRIGDITFVAPDREPFTVEVKTKLMDEQPTGAETISYTYNVAVMSADPAMRSILRSDQGREEERPTSDLDGEVVRDAPRLDERARRQLDRMHKAKQQVDAPHDVLVDAGDERFISTIAEVAGADHSAAMRLVARAARRSGFASRVVEAGLLYAAIYDPEGFEGVDLSERFVGITDALAGGRFLALDGRDGVLINTIPSTDEGSAELYLPYFVHNLPRTTIIDLLRGRMFLLVLVNPGRIAAALDDAGFQTTLEGPMVRPAFNVTTSDGTTLRCELRNLRMPMMEMIMEFQPIDRLVAVAKAMKGSIEKSVVDDVLQRRRAG